MDSTAIEHIAQLAVRAAQAAKLDTDTPTIVLRSDDGGQMIQSLEPYLPGRSRYRGSFTTTSLGAFAAHVIATTEAGNTEGQAQGFIDPENVSAKVFFNLGSLSKPGHGDHTASLKLKPTAAFSAMQAAVRAGFNQRDLGSWLEDWRDYLTPFIGDQPGTTGMAGALAAVRDITVEKARTESNVVRDFGATKSAMETVDAKSSLVLPTAFEFTCAPYEGLKVRAFILRLLVNTSSENLSFGLRLLQAETHQESIAADFLAVLQAKLGTASTLTLGNFTP